MIVPAALARVVPAWPTLSVDHAMLADLPVLDVLSAVHVRAHLTPNPGEIVHDYLD